MSADLLAELKKLQYQRSESSPFASKTEYLQWSDNVAGLLSYDEKLNYRFRQYVSHAKSKMALNHDPIYGVDESIGVMNEAISSLQNTKSNMHDREQTKRSPELEKLTLKWLYEHAPWSFYAWLFGVCAVFFSLGFTASEIKTAIYSKPLRDHAPTTTKPTTASPITNQSSAEKSIAPPLKNGNLTTASSGPSFSTFSMFIFIAPAAYAGVGRHKGTREVISK